MMVTAYLMMTLGEMAPGRRAERAVQAIAVVSPAEGALAGFDQDSAHGMVRLRGRKSDFL